MVMDRTLIGAMILTDLPPKPLISTRINFGPSKIYELYMCTPLSLFIIYSTSQLLCVQSIYYAEMKPSFLALLDST